MISFRKNPVFTSALALCALAALGEGWCIYDRWAASRAAAATLARKRIELHAMGALTPAPTRAIAGAIETDLARAQRALETMQAELKGRGPAAERLRTAKVPAARTDSYFDLATYVEKMRDLAKKLEIDLRPEAGRFGFSAYANEGPEVERIEGIFRQRLVAQYVIESLLAARPRALLAVQRERPLTKAEREAAAAAVANGAPADPVAATPPEGPDYFVMDPRASARVPGYVDSTAFRLVFTGQTAALRTFLNQLASFDLPVLVREVEVEVATGEDVTVAVAAEETAVVEPAAASVVLTAAPRAAKPVGGAKPTPKPPGIAPIVTKPFSKFTVIVEYIELVPPAGAATDDAATATKPTT
ncbi:MAG: hypothetical protein EXS32_14060 [Opitutus sp.]|nr:hypothetical protein [Opitutus sp.]